LCSFSKNQNHSSLLLAPKVGKTAGRAKNMIEFILAKNRTEERKRPLVSVSKGDSG
jgi:hypothetical protein